MSAVVALQALIDASSRFSSVSDKDWAAATGLIVKKLLTSAGQTLDSIRAIRETVGEDIFETQLKSLTPHQARLLARRLDKSVPDFEVSTAGAAIAHVRSLLSGRLQPGSFAKEPPAHEALTEKSLEGSATSEAAGTTETSTETSEETKTGESPPPPPPASGNPYFGRRSFRT
ncbi:hypothetical protein [Hyphomonas sp.]|uniref:hypothetical protein n=1 Tax=Hyphomonas sp. TaxID=87 RepID=UPI00391D6CF2